MDSNQTKLLGTILHNIKHPQIAECTDAWKSLFMTSVEFWRSICKETKHSYDDYCVLNCNFHLSKCIGPGFIVRKVPEIFSDGELWFKKGKQLLLYIKNKYVVKSTSFFNARLSILTLRWTKTWKFYWNRWTNTVGRGVWSWSSLEVENMQHVYDFSIWAYGMNTRTTLLYFNSSNLVTVWAKNTKIYPPVGTQRLSKSLQGESVLCK